jgi:hypothetical protein
MAAQSGKIRNAAARQPILKGHLHDFSKVPHFLQTPPHLAGAEIRQRVV